MPELNPEEAAQLEATKKAVLRKILTKEAVERLGRVRLANPLLVAQLELYLVQLNQSGQLNETIDDEKLKQILGVLGGERNKKRIKIRRK